MTPLPDQMPSESETKFERPHVSADILGCTPITLRRWARAGKIRCYVTPTGKYRYDVQGFLEAHGLRAA